MKNSIAGLEEMIKRHAEKYEGMPIALSGGIDSGLLAYFIKPEFAISVKLPEGEKYDEIKYSKIVCEHLGIKHVIVETDDTKWDEYMSIAVKAIGRPIPHFNIFPLFFMYQKLAKMGVKEVVLGDGPDETMCGYARDLIFNYLYKIYDFEAFENYKPLIDKLLLSKKATISLMIDKNTELEDISKVDVEEMRKDMDDMSNSIARYFGITNYRPYQDNKEIDDYMLNLPIEDKIKDVEFGKYALRKIASYYLPHEIAWRKKKVGGPVYPVNIMRNWDKVDGEFGKKTYLSYQKECLKK